MKTVKQIEKDIKSVKQEMADAAKEMNKLLITPSTFKYNKKRYKDLEKQLESATVCELYLRTEPSEDFVKKEKSRIGDRLKAIDNGYKPPHNYESMPKKELTKIRRQYDKEYQVSKLKAQLKFLEFILK